MRDAVDRWLRVVAADAELTPYLIGVDRGRLARHLALTLTVALGGPAGDLARPAVGAWRGLGLTEAQHRRVVDYLAGVLREVDVPADAVAAAGRVFADEVGGRPAQWPAQVVDHDRAADGIAVLTVRPERGFTFRAGQAVPVSLEDWPDRWRWYSPANAPRPDGTIEFHVRAVAAVSRALVEEVRLGDRIWLGPPRDVGLTLDPASRADLLLIAGGTGLAPLRALVEQVATAPAGRRVTLVVGARTYADLYDSISLDVLQCAHDWLTLVPAFSHDPEAGPGERGDALTVALDHHRSGQEVYVCGPPAMLAGLRLRLLAAGIPTQRIHLPGDPTGQAPVDR
ncbi:hypothetical protein AWW66_26105 [Micromonospora rosaria]|uniref:FAD-binding FR-type domain-containing protein n=1 Tax=Micromonospora rosaria TaxID=47874 RepID=A0A136PL37_9ACTN|nr:hypothetical protein AWW66_26105 [Micromonospora rosaria]